MLQASYSRPSQSSCRAFCPWHWLLFPLLACAALVALTGCGRGEFARLEPLPVGTYLLRPGDYLGNTYSLKGRIDSQIRWEEGVGRILALRPEGSPTRLPVFVPAAAGQNLHVGQIYEMRVVIREGGLIYVEALRKF